MAIIGEGTTPQIESIIFATDFSPASQNAGLYASALSIHAGTDHLVAHAFTLLQASLETEAKHPLASQGEHPLFEFYCIMLDTRATKLVQSRQESFSSIALLYGITTA